MSINNRFDPDKGWQRVLFRPDKKSQVAELHELQSLLNYQQMMNFSYLYREYSITQPFTVSAVQLGEESLTVRVSKGQVYIKTTEGGYFIDVAEQDLTIAADTKTYIGLIPEFSTLGDSEDLKDPITGGWFSGDDGAHRLKLSYKLVLNQDSYPIAIVQGFGASYIPSVFYYSEGGFSRQMDKAAIAAGLKAILARRWFEESGNFAAHGLEITINLNRYLAVSPGVAYILGRRVELTYGYHVALPKLRLTQTPTAQIYKVYLTVTGDIFVLSDNTVPEHSFLLGTVLVDHDNERYQIIPTLDRSIPNSDLRLISDQNHANELAVSQIALDRQAADEAANRRIELSGILTDLFSSLAKSDINHQLYSATLNPAKYLLRGGLSSQTLNFSNLEVMGSTNINLISESERGIYLTASLSNRTLISQTKATSWVALTSVPTTRAAMSITPERGVPDTTSKEYSLVSLSDIPTSQGLVSTTVTTNISLKLQATIVTVNCFGFPANADNLALSFGNVRIVEFTKLNGTSDGTGFATVKAKSDGTVSLSFRIPLNLEAKDYVINLTNGVSSAAAVFALSSLTQPSTSNIPPLAYQTSAAAIAQTFDIGSPLVISGVRLAFRKVPQIQENGLYACVVSLVKTNAGVPTSEVLTQATLPLTSLNTSGNSSVWTDVTFRKPAIVESAGQYALVVSPLVQGAEIYIASVNERSLIDGSISSTQPLLGGNLLVAQGTGWQAKADQDLKFELIQGVPGGIDSELIVKVNNPLTAFNGLLCSLPYQAPAGTDVQLYYKDGGWKPFRNLQQFQTANQSVELKIALKNTSTLCPVLEVGNAAFVTQTNAKSSIWISRTVEYDFSYTNLEVKFQYYCPIGANITCFFSSNAGETWEPLPIQGSWRDPNTLVDGNIPLYLGTFKATNLSRAVSVSDIHGNTSTYLRKKLTIRIDFDTKDTTLVPYIKRLSLITY